ncbi:MAG: TIGR03013 family XrtA/PEP-CTERM system glycosyltransferase [Nitrospirota bacterium]
MNHHLLLVTGDVIIGVIAVYAGSLLRFGLVETLVEVDIVRLFFFVLVTVFISYLLELYNFERRTATRELFLRTVLGVACSFILLTAVYYVIHVPTFFRGMFAVTMGVFGLLQFVWHITYQSIIDSPHLARKVLILGTGPLAKKIGDLIQSTNHQHVLSGYVHFNLMQEPVSVPAHAIVGNGGSITETVKKEKAQKLVVSLAERRGAFPTQEVLDCKFCGVDVVDAPSFYEDMTGKLLIENITPSWFIFSNGFKINATLKLYKQAIDFIFALAGLLFFLPFFPFIALLIKLDSAGPVFFRQIRVGEMDRPFFLYKFRTMRQNAEAGTGAVWAKEDDPRITRLGGLLRKTRIDELPQLYNVLRGDMSLVGPRPERPEFVERLKTVVPYYSERHFVKPGITGWAQIKYPYGASEQDALEKLRYDLYYIKNMSIVLELTVLLETIKVMLFRRGAR